MNKKKIMQALTRLGELAMEKSMEIELCIYGGVAMMLAYDRRAVTKDIDAIFVPSSTTRTLLQQVTEEQKLPSDWLNDDVKQFLSPLSDKSSLRPLPIELPGLKITVPTASYLLAMKAMASRRPLPGYAGDMDDLRYLIKKMNINSVEEVQEHVDRYYPDDVLSPQAKAMISQIIKEVWQ